MPPRLVEVDVILNLAREIAHAGLRPVTPTAAQILGLAMAADPDGASALGRVRTAALQAQRPIVP